MAPHRFTRRLRWARPALLGLTLAALCAPAATPRRVLIVDSFGRDVAPFSAAASAFRTTLASELGEPLDLHEASLETGRFAEPGMEKPLVDFLEQRFAGRLPDLVVPIGAPAARFVAQYRGRLFPETPVVFVAGEPRLVGPDSLGMNATQVTEKVNLAGMVEDILQLQPDTTNVVVVFGASPLEKYWEGECRREFQPFTNRVSFSWLSELPLDRARGEVATLPPRSFVLFTMFTMDAAGVPYDNEAALKVLHAAANAPIYGYFGSQFGLGPIGGRLYQDATVGTQAAQVAIRILRGERASSIARQLIETPFPVYDWRELKRWGISEKRLPAGSRVLFRQPSFWELYRWPIAGAVLFCLLQAALIVGLLVNRARRRESEERLSMAAAAAEVGVWMWDIARNEVWATENWRRMFGFPPELTIRYESFLERIHPEDRPEVERAVRHAIEDRADYVSEHRVVLPDGGQRWIAAQGRLDAASNSQRRRLLGASVDVTQRKRAEEAAHNLSGRLIGAQEEERARLAKELHDGLSQNLALLAVELEMFGQRLPDAPGPITARLQEFSAETRTLSAEVHRISRGLHPAKLAQLGLAVALKSFCREVESAHRLTVQFAATGVPRVLPEEVALCLYRVAQEALQNVVKHSGATGAKVEITAVDDRIELSIADDGKGFDVGASRATGSLGLVSMGERIRLVHGEFAVESKPGQGTRVKARVPLKALSL